MSDLPDWSDAKTSGKRLEVNIPARYIQVKPRDPANPFGTPAAMYTRENLTVLFKCSHGELGRLLARKMAPLPVRIDGQILWYIDEVQNATPQVLRTLERWKQRR
jgi:hypothetical protein